jgi:VanZ family protein
MLPRRLTTRVSLWLPPLVYLALIFHFSSQSDPLPEVTARIWDKLLHAIEYAGLAALLGRAFLGEGLGPATAFAAAALLAAAYGATDEYHQLFVPLRTADVQDWIADAIGASVGALACVLRAPSRP